jgi:tetratricopeptide (TPR) repeat protein
MKTGQFDTAIELLLRALELECNTTECGIFSYNNLASIYFFQRHDYQKAAEYLQKISKSVAKNNESELLLAQALIRLGHVEKANTVLDQLIVRNPTNHTAFYLKGVISLQHASYSHAHEQFKKCIRMGSGNWRYFREIGVCLTHMGYYERGHWFLRLARNILPNDSMILLRLADNRIRVGRIYRAGEWIERLLEKVDLNVLESEFRGLRKNDAWTPLAPETIALISEKVKIRAEQYLNSVEQLREHLSSQNS